MPVKRPRKADPYRVFVSHATADKWIAKTICEKIDPIGVAVVCEGTHLCMAMRGVEKQNSYTVTSAMLGAFRDHARTRMEFLELLKLRNPSLMQAPLPMPAPVSHLED